MKPLYQTRTKAEHALNLAAANRFNSIFKREVPLYVWPKSETSVQFRVLPANWLHKSPYTGMITETTTPDQLPPSPFFKVWQHVNMGPDSQSFLSLQKMLKEVDAGPSSGQCQKMWQDLGAKDPAFEQFNNYRKSGGKDRDTLFRLGPQDKFAVYIRPAAADKDIVMPQIALITAPTYRMIMNAIQGAEGEDPYPYDDPGEDGCDLRMSFEMKLINGKMAAVPKAVVRVEPPRKKSGTPAFLESRCQGDNNVWDWYYTHPLPQMLSFSSAAQIEVWLAGMSPEEYAEANRTAGQDNQKKAAPQGNPQGNSQGTSARNATPVPPSAAVSVEDDAEEELFEDHEDPLDNIAVTKAKPVTTQRRDVMKVDDDEDDRAELEAVLESDEVPVVTKVIPKKEDPKSKGVVTSAKVESKPVARRSSKAWDDEDED